MAASGTDSPQQTYPLPPGFILVDKKHAELLKIWYAIFVAVMDGAPDDVITVLQLKKLRNLLKSKSTDLEAIAQKLSKVHGVEELER